MAITVKIFPPIGIARVGNSPDQYFIGPETPRSRPIPPGGYKDPQGRVKRQAARFRLFAYEGDVLIGEVTAANADIEWTVEVANTKADWYQFAGIGHLIQPRRNGSVSDRSTLRIQPGPRTLTAPLQTAKFDTGKFKGKVVPLGEIRTESTGRLLVLGGFGYSHSPSGSQIGDFANNDDWFDDICDGPVSAKVKFKGSRETIVASSAWVICPAPKFAPPMYPVTSIYDDLLQVAVDKLGYQVPAKPSFTYDIHPVLMKALSVKWVNAYVWSLTAHDTFASVIPPPGTAAARDAIFKRLRDPATNPLIPVPGAMPAVWTDWFADVGDYVNQPLTRVQYQNFKQWRDGNFINDWKGMGAGSEKLTPDGMTRAALETCVGSPFFPGIETSFLTRDTYAYIEPFRLDGTKLKAGDLTKQCAVPWQADFDACQSGGPLLWWPSARPDDVFLTVGGQQMSWDRGIGGADQMVTDWGKLGFLIEKDNGIVEIEHG